jgi:hypothetical protein
MPQYLLLIADAGEDAWWGASQAERDAVYAAYQELSRDLSTRGALRGGAELDHSSTATCVRVRDGETIVTDGPYAESVEQLGGFMQIEAADMQEACGVAARIPTARNGAVEVRPVMEYPTG